MDRPVEELTAAQVRNMTVMQLRGHLSARKLSPSGVKKDLIQRLLDAIGLSEPKEDKPAPLHASGDGWPGTVPNVSMRAMGSEVVASYLAQQQAALQSAKKAADAARAASSAEEASDAEPALAISQAIRPKRGRHGGGKRQKPSAEVASSTRVLRSQRKQESTDENVQIEDKLNVTSVESTTVVVDVQNESIVKSQPDESPIKVEATPAVPASIVHETQSTMTPFSVEDSLATPDTSKRPADVKNYPSNNTDELVFNTANQEEQIKEIGSPDEEYPPVFDVGELLNTANSGSINIDLHAHPEEQASEEAKRHRLACSPKSVPPPDKEDLMEDEPLPISDSDSDTSISSESYSASTDERCLDLTIRGSRSARSRKFLPEELDRESEEEQEKVSTPEETNALAETSSEDATDTRMTELSHQTHSSTEADDEKVTAQSALIEEPEAKVESPHMQEETTSISQQAAEPESFAADRGSVDENVDVSFPSRKRLATTDEQISEPKRKWKTSHEYTPTTVISTKFIESLVKNASQELEAFSSSRSDAKNLENKEQRDRGQEMKLGPAPTAASFGKFDQNEASDTLGKAQKKNEATKNINVNTNALSFDMQWGALVEVNPELAEAITLRGPVSPPEKQPTKVVRITGLSRPFAVRSLRDTMALFGTFLDTHFWINKIRSVCIVQYDSVEAAMKAREALHRVRWPKTNQHCLQVDFGSEGDVEYLNGEGKDDLGQTSRTKPRGDSTGRGREDGASVRRPSEEDSSEYLKDSSPEAAPSPDLDSLFKRTTAKPTIYYLPYTEEQAERIEQEREKRRQERIKYLAKEKEQEALSKAPKPSPKIVTATWNRKYKTVKRSSSSERSNDSSSSSGSNNSNSSRDSRHSSDQRRSRYRRRRSRSKSSSSDRERFRSRRRSRRYRSRSPSSTSARRRRRDNYSRDSFRDRRSFERRRYHGGRR